MLADTIDILEGGIPKEVLDILLQDRTTQKNIFWGTTDYEQYGEGYGEFDEITYDKICDNTKIVPRVQKNKEQQNSRSKDMAEVFTPSWVCNAQNNLIDDAWFGVSEVFNREYIEDGKHKWQTTERVVFPKGKTWMSYVRDNRMEITCGEAPYITSRYDTTTGEPISIENRVGLLDRKLRVVNENEDNPKRWLFAARVAFMSIYGFEWQGDNLLLAREAMLYTFIDNYQHKFGKKPGLKSQLAIAEIISWNLWQMDGLKGVVPNSCHTNMQSQKNIFGEEDLTAQCEGCVKNEIHRHKGTYCIIKDWTSIKNKGKDLNTIIRYIDLLK